LGDYWNVLEHAVDYARLANSTRNCLAACTRS